MDMSFGKAFSYPFQDSNIAKILTITLVFAILIATSFTLLASTLDDFNGLMNFVLAVGFLSLAQALFLSGYGVSIIRAVMNGESKLPAVNLLEDLGRGVVMMIGFTVYMLPLFTVFFCTLMVGTFDTENMTLFFMMILIILPLIFVMAWAAMVGMVRYAAEENANTLFQMGQNISLATSNIGLCFSLLGNQILLGIVWGIGGTVLSSIYDGMTQGALTYDASMTNILTIIIIGYIIQTVVNIISQFSNMHLIAQFGLQLGMATEKMKREFLY
jgi:hypothetical protein